MSPREAKIYLDRISSRGMKPGLERMERIMDAMGRPDRSFKSIHVTGTNGKGSTSAMLESVLRHAGFKTGLYTSPHLIDLPERIQVAGKPIPWRTLAEWIGRIKKTSGPLEPEITYFEIVTAAAFCAFAASRVEAAVFEVGLGGRFDATNVLASPEVVIITNISLDHTEYLGRTRRSIAWEKAHIIKEGSVCVTGAEGEALSPIREACRRLRVPLKIVSACGETLWKKFRPALEGGYQRKNLALVLAASEELRRRGWKISPSAIKEGLKNVRWPGRFEWKKLKGVPVLLDGAHNPGGMEAVLESVSHTGFGRKDCRLVFNALRDKNVKEMARSLQSRLRLKEVLIPNLPTERSSDPSETRKKFQNGRETSVKTFASLKELWAYVGRNPLPSAQWIFATGSLYLVGETLRLLRWQNRSRHSEPEACPRMSKSGGRRISTLEARSFASLRMT